MPPPCLPSLVSSSENRASGDATYLRVTEVRLGVDTHAPLHGRLFQPLTPILQSLPVLAAWARMAISLQYRQERSRSTTRDPCMSPFVDKISRTSLSHFQFEHRSEWLCYKLVVSRVGKSSASTISSRFGLHLRQVSWVGLGLSFGVRRMSLVNTMDFE